MYPVHSHKVLLVLHTDSTKNFHTLIVMHEGSQLQSGKTTL